MGLFSKFNLFMLLSLTMTLHGDLDNLYLHNSGPKLVALRECCWPICLAFYPAQPSFIDYLRSWLNSEKELISDLTIRRHGKGHQALERMLYQLEGKTGVYSFFVPGLTDLDWHTKGNDCFVSCDSFTVNYY